MSRLAPASRRNRFVNLRTAGSPPVAPHPASRRRSYLRLWSCDQPQNGLTPFQQSVLTDALIPRKRDEAKQKAFIAAYEKLLNSMADDEAVLFADARRILRTPRAGCFAPSQEKLATLQTSGRQRIDIRGAMDRETGQPSAGYSNRLRLLEPLACFARMIEAETVDALSTIKLLQAIEAHYCVRALIHVFRDNAHYPTPGSSPGAVRKRLPSVRHTSTIAWEAIAPPSRCARRNLWLSSPGRDAGSCGS